MKIIITSLLLFLITTSYAQNIFGSWSGIMFQEEGGTRAEYYYALTIEPISAHVFKGTSYVQYLDKPDIFGVMEFTAVFTDGKFVFKESHIVKQREDLNMYWCIKQGILEYTERNDSAFLSGKWESWNPRSCSPGTVTLAKPLPMDMNPAVETEVVVKEEVKPETKPVVLPKKEEVKIVTEMKKRKTKLTLAEPVTVKSKLFYIEIFDHGYVDGDSISLFFNDKPILVNYRLTGSHKRIELNYDTTLPDNKLLLHAHNLGESAPNSAAILIFSGDLVQKVSILSDMGESGLIKIKYKP